MVRNKATYLAVVLTALLAVLGLGLSSPVQAAGDPVTCEGYPEPRVFIEAQDWWQPTLSGTENFGHVHIGACWPRTHLADGSFNKITGNVHLDAIVKLHDNPGRLDFVRVHLNDANGGNKQVFRVDIDQKCPTGDCTWNVPVDFDGAASPVDGFQNIRLAAIVQQDDGTKQFAGTALQVYLANGKTVKHQAGGTGAPTPRQVTHGWYHGSLYTNAEFRSWLPYTVSGTWTFNVRLDKGSSNNTVRHSFASIDPDFHHGSIGQVVFERNSAYTGPISIDTRGLSNGPHKLFLRADAPCNGLAGNNCGTKPGGASNNVSTNSGAQAITFIVAN